MKGLDIDHNLSPGDLKLAMRLFPELYNSKTVGPWISIRDWEHDFVDDMKMNLGFVVKSKPFKKKTRDKEGKIITKGTKEMYGIHSPLFGTDWLDDNAFADRFSCECGDMIGKLYLGRKCPKCGTKVTNVEVNFKMFAWIVIKDPKFAIIHPLLYNELKAYMGKIDKKYALDDIIEFKMDMKLDGFYDPSLVEGKDKNPFKGIGMIEFHRRFYEIMAWFAKKNKNKAMQYDLIMENKDKIFVTKIPVYSAVLREVFFTDEKYSYRKIDRFFNSLYGNTTHINEETEVKLSNVAKLNDTLFRAQRNLNGVFVSIFTSLTENEGLIRRNILGGRINNSSRCVIVPDASLRSYQIRLPLTLAA